MKPRRTFNIPPPPAAPADGSAPTLATRITGTLGVFLLLAWITHKVCETIWP
jgi:hypothetical protein